MQGHPGFEIFRQPAFAPENIFISFEKINHYPMVMVKVPVYPEHNEITPHLLDIIIEFHVTGITLAADFVAGEQEKGGGEKNSQSIGAVYGTLHAFH